MMHLHIKIIHEIMMTKCTVNSHIKKNRHCVLKLNANIYYKYLKHVQTYFILFASAMNLHRNAYLHVMLHKVLQKEQY